MLQVHGTASRVASRQLWTVFVGQRDPECPLPPCMLKSWHQGKSDAPHTHTPTCVHARHAFMFLTTPTTAYQRLIDLFVLKLAWQEMVLPQPPPLKIHKMALLGLKPNNQTAYNKISKIHRKQDKNHQATQKPEQPPTKYLIKA